MGNCAGVYLHKCFETQINPKAGVEFCESHSETSSNANANKNKNSIRKVKCNNNNNIVNLSSRSIKVSKIQGVMRGFIYRHYKNKLTLPTLPLINVKIPLAPIKPYSSSLLKMNKTNQSDKLQIIDDFISIGNNYIEDEFTINKKYMSKVDKLEIDHKYNGEYLDGKKNGLGKLQWIEGSVYIGKFTDNKANGYGKLIHKDGDIYLGNWITDKANGIGKYINLLFDSYYEGFWLGDKQSGFGIEVWSKGNQYEGYYTDGKKNGIGVLRFEDGAYYHGQFESNNICGIGTFYFRDNRVYQGEWKNNKMNGFGVITWPNGNLFQGTFLNDKKEGWGVYYSNNKVYIADWKYSKLDGIVFVIENGVVKTSEWENGKKIQNLLNNRSILGNVFFMEIIKPFN